MCGISAYVGKQNPDAMKLRLLLMYNESRGGDASGVFINNNIIKDGIKHKKAPEFLANNDISYDPDVENKIFITHNRKGTVGSNTTENAHPHIIDHDFVLVQNGTIKNIWDLCNKYKIDHKDITNDSKALALLIDRVGYQILNEYIGFAALIFTRISEPNVLYVFKGASSTYINGKLEEERPLYYLYNEHTNEMFFSSIPDSLYAINNNEGFAIPVKSNYVYRVDFTGEKIKMRAIFKSNRGVSGINNGVNSYGTTFKGAYAQRSTYNQGFYERHRWDQYEDCYIPSKKEMTTSTTSTVAKNQESVREEKNKYYTSFDKFLFTDQIVSVKDTRYICNKKLMHGQFHITDSGVVKEKPVDKLTKIYYFVYGVMIENSVNYNLLTRETKHDKAEPNCNFAFFMSNFSKYPVIHSEKDVSDLEKVIYYKGKIVKDCYVRMVFSDKIMMVKNYIIETVTIISTKNSWSNSERAVLCGSKTKDDLTINKSEEYTKENYNRVRSLEKKNLYLGPKQDVQVQQSINFNIKNILNKKTPNIFDVIPELDTIYDEPKDFYDTIPVESMICIHLFIEEHFSDGETMSVEDINENLFLILLDSIQQKCTLRELIQENTIMVESFSSAAYIEFENLKINNTISGLKEKYGYNLEEKISRPQERTVYNSNNTEVEDIENEYFEEEPEEDPIENAKNTFDYVVIDMMDALETIDAGEKEIQVIENVNEKYMGLKLVAKEVKEFFSNKLMNFFDSYQEKEKKELLVNKQERMNA